MSKEIKADLEACKICTVGSCCYEGVELSPEELKKIVVYKPAVAKPWFRLIEADEDPDGVHHFSTLVRNGTCVFQDGQNRCMVYDVRPHYCRDFPLENNQTAPHYQRLCVLFRDQWPKDGSVRKNYDRRENSSKKD